MKRKLVAPVLILTATFAPLAQLGPTLAVERKPVNSDFNGDGYSDMAVGAPGYSYAVDQSGEVNVLYGGPSGVSSQADQLWRPDSPGLNWGSEAIPYSLFGEETAIADFNGDGFADLAIGSPRAEQVNVLYGSADGLTTVGDQRWRGSSPGLAEPLYTPYALGGILTTGDFNGDGFAELAMGVVDNADESGRPGYVRVLYGSASGLATEGNQLWTEGTPGLKGVPPPNDNDISWAGELAAGDFGKGGEDDLAISEAGNRGGYVHVLYGSIGTGLSVRDDQLWSLDSWGVPGQSMDSARFGGSLAVGDFGGAKPGFEDLAIGVIGLRRASGALVVLYARKDGLVGKDSQIWTQDTFGVEDEAEPNDLFGGPLAAGDFNADGHDDLAIGVTGEDTAVTSDAGAVSVLYASYCWPSGFVLCATGDELWTLDTQGVPGRGESLDGFGRSLASGDFGAGGAEDLVIGIPQRDVGGSSDAGAVAVIYGSSRLEGLTSAASQLWTQESAGVKGQPRQQDYFG